MVSSCCWSNCTATNVINICVYSSIYSYFFVIGYIYHTLSKHLCPYTFFINKDFIHRLKKNNPVNTWNLSVHTHTYTWLPPNQVNLLIKCKARYSKLWNIWHTTTPASQVHVSAIAQSHARYCMSHNPQKYKLGTTPRKPLRCRA